jgi:tetratricopeptide (TPR) repeat protein
MEFTGMSKQEEEAHLAGLGEKFMAALESRRDGKVDDAKTALQEILAMEPRLAEPRMELASISLEAGQLDEAEAQAEEAVRLLESDGQWTEELPDEVVLSIAWSLLGESLRRQAETDAIVFGDPAVFTELTQRAKNAFIKAEALDPHNDHASDWAAGLQRVQLDGE